MRKTLAFFEPGIDEAPPISFTTSLDWFGWKAVIRSSRLNDASALKTDIPGFPLKHSDLQRGRAWPKTRDLCPCRE
jgi:hypothetical protein